VLWSYYEDIVTFGLGRVLNCDLACRCVSLCWGIVLNCCVLPLITVVLLLIMLITAAVDVVVSRI